MKIKGGHSGKWNTERGDTWSMHREHFLKMPLLAHSSIVREILSKVNKQSRILEFGCGSGTYSIYLAKLGYKVTATDYEKSALSLSESRAKRHLSREQLANLEFKILDAENMDLPDASYDLIFNAGAIEHLNIDDALMECRRVLRKSGWNIASVPFLSLRWDILWKLSNLMTKNSPRTQFLSKAEWEEKFKRFFVDVKIIPAAFVPEAFLMRIFGPNLNYSKFVGKVFPNALNSDLLISARHG